MESGAGLNRSFENLSENLIDIAILTCHVLLSLYTKRLFFSKKTSLNSMCLQHYNLVKSVLCVTNF
jgi:hypothetical protein